MTEAAAGPPRQTYLTAETLDSVTARHLELIAPYNRRAPRFIPEQAALIVVDMQRFFLESGFPLYTPNGAVILPRVARLAGSFRSAGRPVIFAAQQNKGQFVDRGECLRAWWPTLPQEGSPEVEVSSALEVSPTEKVIPKRRYSSFHATDLELTLRSLRVTQVVVCGLFTNVCVEATVRDAFMCDFLPFLPADCTAALNEELHLGSLRTQAHWFARVLRSADLL